MFKRLREDLGCARRVDPSARSTLEILLCNPGLHALTAHRFAHWLWMRDVKLVARLIAHWTRWLTGIEIHPRAVIGRRCFVDHGMGVVIGETAEIGEDVIIYQGVTLGATALRAGKRHPTIEDRVLLGAGAKIMGPVTVHTGAKVGCNAVVLTDVPAGATAVGVPASIVTKSARRVVETYRSEAEDVNVVAEAK